MGINIFENEPSKTTSSVLSIENSSSRSPLPDPSLLPSDLKSNNSPNNYVELYARVPSPFPPLPYFITIRIRWSRSWNFYNRIPGRKESQTSVHLEFNTEQIAKLERNYTPPLPAPRVRIHSLYTRSCTIATHTRTHVSYTRLYIHVYVFARVPPRWLSALQIPGGGGRFDPRGGGGRDRGLSVPTLSP